MSLPYETATSGEKAVNDMQKILRSFGCSQFGSMLDYEKGELIVQFKHKGTPVQVRASINGYAAAWLKAHPYNSNHRCTLIEYERRAKDIASIAVYSIMRDWVKSSVAMVESNLMSFEGCFLGQILLPNGKTILEHAREKALLPAPENNVVNLK